MNISLLVEKYKNLGQEEIQLQSELEELKKRKAEIENQRNHELQEIERQINDIKNKGVSENMSWFKKLLKRREIDELQRLLQEKKKIDDKYYKQIKEINKLIEKIEEELESKSFEILQIKRNLKSSLGKYRKRYSLLLSPSESQLIHEKLSDISQQLIESNIRGIVATHMREENGIWVLDDFNLPDLDDYVNLPMADMSVDDLIMVHTTEYLPLDGNIRSSRDAQNLPGASRNTVHFALNGRVTEVEGGNDWDKMPIMVLEPLRNQINKNIINVAGMDTFSFGTVHLSSESIILINKDYFDKMAKENSDEIAKLKEKFRGRIVLYNGDPFIALHKILLLLGYKPQKVEKYKWEDDINNASLKKLVADKFRLQSDIHKTSPPDFTDKYASARNIQLNEIRNTHKRFDEGEVLTSEELYILFQKYYEVIEQSGSTLNEKDILEYLEDIISYNSICDSVHKRYPKFNSAENLIYSKAKDIFDSGEYNISMIGYNRINKILKIVDMLFEAIPDLYFEKFIKKYGILLKDNQITYVSYNELLKLQQERKSLIYDEECHKQIQKLRTILKKQFIKNMKNKLRQEINFNDLQQRQEVKWDYFISDFFDYLNNNYPKLYANIYYNLLPGNIASIINRIPNEIIIQYVKYAGLVKDKDNYMIMGYDEYFLAKNRNVSQEMIGKVRSECMNYFSKEIRIPSPNIENESQKNSSDDDITLRKKELNNIRNSSDSSDEDTIITTKELFDLFLSNLTIKSNRLLTDNYQSIISEFEEMTSYFQLVSKEKDDVYFTGISIRINKLIEIIERFFNAIPDVYLENFIIRYGIFIEDEKIKFISNENLKNYQEKLIGNPEQLNWQVKRIREILKTQFVNNIRENISKNFIPEYFYERHDFSDVGFTFAYYLKKHIDIYEKIYELYKETLLKDDNISLYEWQKLFAEKIIIPREIIIEFIKEYGLIYEEGSIKTKSYDEYNLTQNEDEKVSEELIEKIRQDFILNIYENGISEPRESKAK